MKKLLAMIVTIAMVMTMITVPAAAATSVGNVKVSISIPESNGGLYGKAAGEYAKAMTTDTSNPAKSVMIVDSSADYDFSDSKYVVLDLNMAPNSSAEKISAGPNAGLFAVETSDFDENRWNSVRVVVEEKIADEMHELGTYQPMTIYVNGVKAAEGAKELANGDKTAVGTEIYGKGFRFNIHGPASTATMVGYIADVNISVSDVNEAPVMPTLASGASFTVNDDGTITFGDDTTVTLSDIKAANSDVSVSAFTDDSFAIAVGNDDILVKGNVLVVKSSDNLYTYYRVASGSYGETVLKSITTYADFNLTVGNGEKSQVSGIGGKDASDSSIWLRQGSSSVADTHFNYSWGNSKSTSTKPDSVLDYDWDKKCGTFTGYLVYEYSILNIDCTTVQIQTDYGTVITDNYADFIPKNAWTRVKVAIDRTDTTNNKTKSMVYINGVPTSAVWKETNSLGDHYGTYKAKNTIRVAVKGGNAATGGAYVDDISIYEAKTLRDIETVSISDGAGYDLVDNAIVIPAGGSLDLSDIVCDSGYTVKGFNADASAQVSSLTTGCIVTVEGKSTAAQELGYTYNDMYACYTVTEAKEKYELIATTPDFNMNNGTCEAVTANVFGNTSGDVKKVTLGSTNNYCQHTWTTVNPGAQYLVYSVNVAPIPGDAAISGVRFGTNGHGEMSASALTGQQLTENAWNNVTMVYDIDNDTSDLYVNGVLVSYDYASKYVRGTNNALRFIIEGTVGAQCYVDDLYIYESSVVPTVPQPAKFAEGYSNKMLVNNANSTANINSSVTVADAAAAAEGGTLTAYTDNTYAAELGSSDTFTDGNLVVIKSADNVYITYTVSTHDSDTVIAAGDTYDGAGNMTTGTIGLYAPVSDRGVLFAAQYDADGKLIKLVVDDTVENDTLKIEFETEEVDKSKVRAFLFESAGNLKPLCKPLEIGVRDYINFLILGNSYSMDVTWHLRQIAAADDVLMNVHVLNKGGCHLRYHYENRNGNPAELGINFWENNKSMGTLYNLEQVLEKFDWDYVAIQASSTTQGLDDTSDANYEENWAVAVPFAQYIHEKEPDARLVIHSTWSMETGYNYVDSDETRDSIMDNFRTLNNRCAEEINSTLGLEGDEQVLVICSTDIIDAARAYAPAQDITINGSTCATGTKLFDTTYYKTGHIFSSKE
ncbi:MAG: hypothetical protein IJ365_06445, partial [Clostridia bacterium]|nr:hypothetical protein [Clostridia bacterium]